MNKQHHLAVPEPKRGLTSQIVKIFTTSQLSILFLIISMLAGAAALMLMPREEDPQIVAPRRDRLASCAFYLPSAFRAACAYG